MKNFRTWMVIFLVAALMPLHGASADENTITLQSTTSTKNSGLYEYLLPLIKADTGITARVVAVGTGAAIRNAMNCDADILLVHSRAREEKFVADGFATRRHDVMYNDFIIIGPPDDPAGIAGANGDAVEALRKIAASAARFASRGDESGTHSQEMALWQEAGVNPLPFSGKWYRELGAGMGATINTAIGMGAYTITDRATWIRFRNKADYIILLEGDARLKNHYGVMPVSDTHCPNVKTAAGARFIAWLLSPRGQAAIAAYKVGDAQLFFPNAGQD